GRAGVFGGVEGSGDGGGRAGAEYAPVPHAALLDELVDRLHRAADGDGAATHVLRGRVEHDLSVLDEGDVFQQVGDFVDEVCGQQDCAWVVRIVVEQPVVEQLPRYGVEPGVRFVEQGQFRTCGHSDHGGQCGSHAA